MKWYLSGRLRFVGMVEAESAQAAVLAQALPGESAHQVVQADPAEPTLWRLYYRVPVSDRPGTLFNAVSAFTGLSEKAWKGQRGRR